MSDKISELWATITKLQDDRFKLTAERDRYREALESISKNSCCNTCQEAKLVALSALQEVVGGGSSCS